MQWRQQIKHALQQRKESQNYRQRILCRAGGRLLWVQGKQYLNFSSNDYLGLSQCPQVIAAWQEGARQYGVGSGASSHIIGYMKPHQQLEEQLAAWLGYPRALLFNSGYAANQAVILALMGKQDRIVADKLSHASLLEAGRCSPARLYRFLHNQPDSLANVLSKPCAGNTLVVTEGIFSMDGDIAPLQALHTISQQQGAWLMVDDAHGIGFWGKQGRGSCHQQRVKPGLLIVTFGKALGVGGAAILCDDSVAEYLLQFATHMIYSTNMPPAQACAIQAALLRIQQGDDLRQRLQQNIHRFRAGMKSSGAPVAPSETAIQPLLLGESHKALTAAQALWQQGICTIAIRVPTVPPGQARLRITLSALHTPEDIDRLLEILHGQSSLYAE
ncbi:MAG: 8-amino-7-oxononanoate synthase [Enterobacteriaceae bacterium]